MSYKKSKGVVDNGDGSKSIEIEIPTELATGSVISRSYDGDLFQLAEMRSGALGSSFISGGKESSAKESIRKTIFYWEKEPVVYKCITLLAYLANDTFTISSENKKVEIALKEWWRSIRGGDFLKYFFLEYFRSGNVPVLKTKVKYVPKNVTTKSEERFEKITGGYTILNPLNISIKSTNVPGIKQSYLELGDDFISLLRDGSNIKKLKDAFPEELVSLMSSGSGEIALPSDMFTMLTKDKQPYEEWALPLTSHAFEPLDYKQSLREMDKSTTSGVRNRILKVTIGSDNFPVIDNKELTVLASKFKNPSKNLTIFWNHTLKMEYIEPNLNSLNIDKYNPALNDIRAAYGISSVLLGENGDSAGNNTLCLKGMMEILEEARETFLSWFFREINDVANIIIGTKEDEVSVKFGTLNLKDENDFFRVVMQMIDRQVISYETAMETMGYYFPKEVKRLETEKKLREEKGILMAQKAPTQGANSGDADPSQTGGRPKGGEKEGERKESQDKPKTPSGIKTVSRLKKEVAIAIADKQSVKDIKRIVSQCLDDLNLEDSEKSLAEYAIETTRELKNKDKADVFIDKVVGNLIKK